MANTQTPKWVPNIGDRVVYNRIVSDGGITFEDNEDNIEEGAIGTVVGFFSDKTNSIAIVAFDDPELSHDNTLAWTCNLSPYVNVEAVIEKVVLDVRQDRIIDDALKPNQEVLL